MRPTFLLWALATVAATACRQSDAAIVNRRAPAAPSGPFVRSIQIDDDTFSVLVKPIRASRNTAGDVAIADASDRNVKIYAADGHRVETIGSAGHAAGQFTHVSDAQFLGDSLLAYDFNLGRVTVFSPTTNRVARTISPRPAPYDVRVLDDSLLLYVRHPGQGGPLLTVAKRDGRAVTSFFSISPFRGNPSLKFLSGLYADGHDGIIYAAFFGADSVYAFGYDGRPVGAARVPTELPLERLDDRLAAHGGQMQRPDSTWFQDGIRAVMGIVGLRDSSVALQIGVYDARRGTDLMRASSEVVIARISPRGVIARERREASGLLAGRDLDGVPLLLSAPGHSPDTPVLSRLGAAGGGR